jgi:hypothetical protein
VERKHYRTIARLFSFHYAEQDIFCNAAKAIFAVLKKVVQKGACCLLLSAF